MKVLSRLEQVHIANAVMGTKFRSWKELNTHIQKVRARLQTYWDATENLDVYEDPEYVYEAINSFGKSFQCVDMLCRYFSNEWGTMAHGSTIQDRNYVARPFHGKIGELTCLDVYAGNGFTSAVMALNGFGSVETVGSSAGQLAFQQATEAHALGRSLKNHATMPAGTYDVVCTFEVLEHFKEPIPHLRELMARVAPGGFLCESRGFSMDPNVGHYKSYIGATGEVLTPARVTRQLTKVLKSEFTLVCDCFRKPRIWQRT